MPLKNLEFENYFIDFNSYLAYEFNEEFKRISIEAEERKVKIIELKNLIRLSLDNSFKSSNQ